MIQRLNTASVERLGRLRQSAGLRALTRETRWSARQLIQPVFFVEEASAAGPIASMPGIGRHALADAPRVADELQSAGVGGIMLFGVPATKDDLGSAASVATGVVPSAARRLRAAWPEAVIVADVCLCQYTAGGDCFVRDRQGPDPVATLERYADAAVAYAEAGVDLVAPSGMLDGSVAAIRAGLDRAGHVETGILAYAVKYASALYAPFRDAAASAPAAGDRRHHQLDPANRREALREALQDVAEGAEIVMVKPALAHADVIADLRARLSVPIAAYQVSGEYAMLESAVEKGWLDRRTVTLEWLTGLVRAGADIVITYYAAAAGRWLQEGETR